MASVVLVLFCAQLPADDRLATARLRILGEDAFAQSACDVCFKTRRLEPQARFEALSRDVIPESNRLRLDAEFSPTHPPAIRGSADSNHGRRVSTGGELMSTALDLVEAATAIHQLDELLARIAAIQGDTLATRKNRSALLILIHLRKNNLPSALKELDLFAQLCAEPQPSDRQHRASELVVFEGCVHDPRCYEVTLPLVERIVAQHRREKDLSIWSQQARTRRGVAVPQPRSHEDMSGEVLPQWQSAGLVKAKTRGMGIPDSRWILGPGRADNVVSHRDDFLYFASPLVGSYQLECEATAFNWMEARLFAGGIWVSPTYDLSHFETGSLNEGLEIRNIQPPLTPMQGLIHLRMAVHPEETHAFANGRLIHSQQTPLGIDPWVGIRSGFQVEGSVFDVRVTGQPEIPTTIDLTASPTLDGWRPYFQDGTDPVLWRKSSDGIFGLRDPKSIYVSTPEFREEALLYHRPMFEDGSIDYEFLYRQPVQSSKAGAICAHVVLDRLCLLIRPDGVAVHWLTDGRFDRTDLSPENAVIVPEHQRSTGPLPLKNGDWNQATFTVAGDVLRLALNGEIVFERPIESTNQRRFGFFYFADQEELQVRRVRWTGDWPQTLPATRHQTLALPESELLNPDPSRLSSMFEHDFAKDGIAKDQITLIQGVQDENFVPVDDGVKATISAASGYRNATLAPAIRIQGDFDVIAEYERLTTSPPISGSSSIMLVTFFDNPTRDEALITRRHMHYSAKNVQQIVQCAIVKKTLESEKRDYFVTQPMEESSGRLRLSRRGQQMFYMSAEGNSENFRLRGTREVAREPIQMNGIRLVTQIHGKGSSEVVWKRLTVRAEKVTGEGSDELDERVAVLNQQREKLPVHVTFDFTKRLPANSAMYRWGDVRPWNNTLSGLPILSVGAVKWESSGIALLQPIQGDFDVQVEFEILKLAEPAAESGTAIFLQMEASDELQSQIGAMFSKSSGGATEFASQIRTRSSDGKLQYSNHGPMNAKDAVLLRVVRRGRFVTVLGRPTGSTNDRLISQFECHDSPIDRVKFLLHTGGPDRNSDILLKSLSVHAEHYNPDPVAIEGVQP